MNRAKHTGKISVICYLLILSCCLIFLFGCNNLLNPPVNNGHLSSGTGYLTLGITGDNSGRTILPNGTWNGDAYKIKLTFNKPGTKTQAFTPVVVDYKEFSGISGGKLELASGTYDLEVTAYSDTTLNNAVAYGEKKNIVIPEGGEATVKIMLYAIIGSDSAGEGKFSWNIRIASDAVPLNAATMTINPYSDNGTLNYCDDSPYNLLMDMIQTAGQPLDLTGSVFLKAGYYDVIFYFERDDSSITIRKFLHVYGNLESILDELTITEDFFGKSIITMNAEGPATTLTPVDPVTFTVSFSGFVKEADASGVWLNVSFPAYPAEFVADNANAADGEFNPFNGTKTFHVTVRFEDGSNTALPSNLNINIEPKDLPGLSSGYILYDCGTKMEPVTVIDGKDQGRSILVNQENILRFNAYANTTTGLSRYYKLTQNITLVPPSPGISNWTAIGDNHTSDITSQFSGTFDGQGNTIKFLTINDSMPLQGMFGYNSGIIKNTGLIEVDINSFNSYIGGVVGFNNTGGSVSNCYVTGDITGYQYIGGVVGGNAGGIVESCYVTGSVSGYHYVGGVVGGNTGGTVQNCYATNSVTGDIGGGSDGYYIGGVVGGNAGSPSIVQNCYSTGVVKGNQYTSGVVGCNNYIVQYCVALNPSIEAIITSGRVVGFDSLSLLTSNHARSNMAALDSSFPPGNGNGHINGADIAAGESIGQYNRQDFWSSLGWDFTANGAWEWNNSAKLPILRGFKSDQNPTVLPIPNIPPNTNWYNPTAPYFTISTPAELAGLAQLVNGGNSFCEIEYDAFLAPIAITPKTIYLDADINLSGYGAEYNGGKGWIPIGTSDKPFKGIFDGSSGGTVHTITGLYINNTAVLQEGQGLFGFIEGVEFGGSYFGGKVMNLGLINVNISSKSSYTGGVTGKNKNGMPEKCYVTGTVKGDSYVGSIVGDNERGTVQLCYSQASVNSTGNNSGGIVGRNSGIVRNCYTTGNVEGISGNGNYPQYIGGIVGFNYYGGVVENCYTTGAISGDKYIGGVVGSNEGYDDTSGPLVYSKVQYCVALNPGIKAVIMNDFGRVVGTSDATLINNKARSDMQNESGLWAYTGDNNLDGADVTLGIQLSSIFSTASGWASSSWSIGSSNLNIDLSLPTLIDIPQIPAPTLPVSGLP